MSPVPQPASAHQVLSASSPSAISSSLLLQRTRCLLSSGSPDEVRGTCLSSASQGQRTWGFNYKRKVRSQQRLDSRLDGGRRTGTLRGRLEGSGASCSLNIPTVLSAARTSYPCFRIALPPGPCGSPPAPSCFPTSAASLRRLPRPPNRDIGCLALRPLNSAVFLHGAYATLQIHCPSLPRWTASPGDRDFILFAEPGTE